MLRHLENLLCREICKFTWCPQLQRGWRALSRRAQPAVWQSTCWAHRSQKGRSISGQHCKHCPALPGWGRHSTRICPIPAIAVSPVHIPHWRSPGGGYSSALCLHLLPTFPLAAEAALYTILLLHGKAERWPAPASPDSFEGNNLIMQTWNWICPYPWGTSPLMAVAVFPWAS